MGIIDFGTEKSIEVTGKLESLTHFYDCEEFQYSELRISTDTEKGQELREVRFPVYVQDNLLGKDVFFKREQIGRRYYQKLSAKINSDKWNYHIGVL